MPYLESTVRTDLSKYDSMSLRIKEFKRSTFNPEVTVIVLRIWKPGIGQWGVIPTRFTLHAGINFFARLTEWGPKEIESENGELVQLARQVIDTRDYQLIGVLLDRAVELDEFPAHPYWFTQWRELVMKHCTKKTQYRERLRLPNNNNSTMVLPDVQMAKPYEIFIDAWEELERDGLVPGQESEEFDRLLRRWTTEEQTIFSERCTAETFILRYLYSV